MTKTNPADAILREDLLAFAHWCFLYLYPGKDFVLNWHLEAMAFDLQSAFIGQSRKLIFNLPPRSQKSFLNSVVFPVWLLGKDPGLEIMTVSYGDSLPRKFSRLSRQIMESDRYRRIFPDTIISPAKNTELEIETTVNGGRFASSMNGPITGRGANYIIIDDPHKTGPGNTPLEQSKGCQAYDELIFPRLTKKAEGRIILATHRCGVNDLTGHLLSKGGYIARVFPAIATQDQSIRLSKNRWHERKKGDVLNPIIEPLDILKEIEKNEPSTFQIQYQQNPTSTLCEFLGSEYFGRYGSVGNHCDYESIVQSFDCASSVEEKRSYSVCLTAGIKDGKFYILDVLRERLKYPDLLKAAFQQVSAYQPSHVVIEEALMGIPLYYALADRYKYGISAYLPKGDKVHRIEQFMNYFMQKRIVLPNASPWLSSFEHEVFNFPATPYDDQVDALSQLLISVLKFGMLNKVIKIDYSSHPCTLEGFK